MPHDLDCLCVDCLYPDYDVGRDTEHECVVCKQVDCVCSKLESVTFVHGRRVFSFNEVTEELAFMAHPAGDLGPDDDDDDPDSTIIHSDPPGGSD